MTYGLEIITRSWQYSRVALRRLAEVAQYLFMYFVYSLFNKKHNKIYIGQTSNLEQRIALHNNCAFKHCYTSRFDGEWILIYKEIVEDRQKALIREKQLKSYRGREFVRNLIIPG